MTVWSAKSFSVGGIVYKRHVFCLFQVTCCLLDVSNSLMYNGINVMTVLSDGAVDIFMLSYSSCLLCFCDFLKPPALLSIANMKDT